MVTEIKMVSALAHDEFSISLLKEVLIFNERSDDVKIIFLMEEVPKLPKSENFEHKN